jgi:hypothetical protein
VIISRVYFNGVFQGQTTGTSWSVSSLGLQYLHLYNWRIDTYDTNTNLSTTGDTWTFTTKQTPTIINYVRPDDYNPDLTWGWNPDTSTYDWNENTDLLIAGGGKYQSNLVVIGQDINTDGIIYYQTIYDDPESESGYPIIGSDWTGDSASTLYISGDHAAEFLNQSYKITGSSNGNDGTYISGFDGVVYNSGEDRTEIVCDPALSNEPIDGTLTVI